MQHTCNSAADFCGARKRALETLRAAQYQRASTTLKRERAMSVIDRFPGSLRDI
jgi:hypothetical protein